MADLTVSQNDKGFYLNFTIQNNDGTAFDLTGYVITLKVWSQRNSPTILCSGLCSIVDATSGKCRYLVGENDFKELGLYKLELELTAIGVVISTRAYTLEVLQSV